MRFVIIAEVHSSYHSAHARESERERERHIVRETHSHYVFSFYLSRSMALSHFDSCLMISFLLFQEREDFIKLHKISGTDEISADQMSVFYKSFLDKNRRIHLMYNISWYLKNFEMLTLAFAVEVEKLLSRLRKKT